MLCNETSPSSSAKRKFKIIFKFLKLDSSTHLNLYGIFPIPSNAVVSALAPQDAVAAEGVSVADGSVASAACT